MYLQINETQYAINNELDKEDTFLEGLRVFAAVPVLMWSRVSSYHGRIREYLERLDDNDIGMLSPASSWLSRVHFSYFKEGNFPFLFFIFIFSFSHVAE